MAITKEDRNEAARSAIYAEQNRAESPIPGHAYGGWKRDPQKGWIQEASVGGVTIYKPWVGRMGSSPANPNPVSGTDAADFAPRAR